MAPVTPTSEPTQATAGSSWIWTVASTTYPVSEGWTLSYVIAGVRTLAWSAGYVASSGETRTVTIPTTATAPLLPGRYEVTRVWTGSGAYSGQRFDEALPPLVVAGDPAAASPGSQVTFAEANLAHVERAITARLCGDQPEEYEIGGRSVTRMSLPELKKTRATLQAELWRLRNPGKSGRTVYVQPTVAW